MRWIVSIVTALCLLAAANERPDPRRYGAHDPQLTVERHGAAAWSARRGGGSAHHARLDAFVATIVTQLPPPRLRAGAVATTFVSAPASRQPPRSTWIRGPPLG